MSIRAVLLTILYIVLAIILCVAVYYFAIWALGMAGIAVPVMAIRITIAVVAVLIAIWIVKGGGAPFNLHW